MNKIYLMLIVMCFLIACSVERITTAVPIVETYEPESVQTNTAIAGGRIINEAGTLNEYGLLISATGEPTLADQKVNLDAPYYDFAGTINGLSPLTTYYYKAYGTNDTGTGYGETYSFTTGEEAACSFTQDNRINTGTFFNTISITGIEIADSGSWVDGNIIFETTSYYSGIRLFLGFNEVNGRLPLTGTYTTVSGFESQEARSQGKVNFMLTNYSSSIGGAAPPTGTKIYVQNNNGAVTFIFCNILLNQYYTLNGKFTYRN
jgi:hypothetical protein